MTVQAEERERVPVETPVPLLRMQGIVKSFPGVKALRGVSLELQAGHVMAIVGENGAGKSSLVKTLSGAYEPDEGTIEIDGVPLARGTHAAIDAGVAVIYQELSLINDMTVAENLFLGRMPARKGFLMQREANRLARAALARVGLDDVPPWMRLGDLPLNKRQLVEVAKAITRDARILVMDEPTAALQSQDIVNLYAVVRRLRAAGMGIIFISHHLEEVFELADSAVVMRDGATVGARPMSQWTEAELVQAMVARNLESFYPWEPREYGDVVLEVRDLASAPLLRNASFKVRAGEIVGIAGIAGAGRTELLKTIFGALPATAGEIRVKGRKISNHSPTEGVRHGLVYTSEDRKLEGLVLDASIEENIALSSLKALATGGFVSRARKRKLARDASTRFNVRSSSVLQVTGTLSGGNQQKVILGRATATQPVVIMLDEPTRGIDVGAKTEIYAHMVSMARAGAAVVMVSSELPELLGMSDRVLVMYRGSIVTEIARDNAHSEAVIQWATTGAGA
ncbi:Ribose import ATP-binding protein RbsA [Paraburkholderia graminis C4D1M]|jgi:ribose transport system ATP-binding protein/rhamnose transport system ATP-binding protein|uniref:ABC transporter related n=1 Tax=Paraburkholderia graminis (strain ATCC 700544 / DSM 17151 / LMG 18924 / NCIMB 13744 / C4D1M) TaxID=396598 RepID=B1G1G8_PARG4|nr:sugar ABC transporter ATP-binding protein [Paraburkholderia graminis]EDT09891.1 ABC transporter related [Paraburkholderia graminis C4D1M]CAB3669359.1 Ribose import ATP-binding protein RbsA [Paraburkholderia graminis C4D1M]